MKNEKTFTRNLANILCHDPMARIIKAEYQYKAQSMSSTQDIVDTTTMLESLASLEDNVVFSNVVDWTYENVSEISDTEDFIVYGDLHDSIVGTVVVMYLLVEDDFTVEYIEQKLKETIFNKKVV